jgi:hypothetical protein
MSPDKIRTIAFYLPQYHPIPENDEWWGKGFTEWTNVGKAKPLFKGHYQPRIPADLGYYDLRLPEAREAQAQLAKEYGIEGFCYWHYWFGHGKRLLERPFNEVLASGKPDFNFCLAWANESWRGFDHGLTNRNVLIEQQYPGLQDYENHFYEVLTAFKDPRYIKVDCKPLFMIYKPLQLPNAMEFIQLWSKLALKNGLEGIYFVGHVDRPEDMNHVLNNSFNAVNVLRLHNYFKHGVSVPYKLFDGIRHKLLSYPHILNYRSAVKWLSDTQDQQDNVFPTILSGWDHTPRSGKYGIVLKNYSPDSFKEHVQITLNNIRNKKYDNRVVFIKSWNEWAEGNYLEPDRKFGLKYLSVFKDVVALID